MSNNLVEVVCLLAISILIMGVVAVSFTYCLMDHIPAGCVFTEISAEVSGDNLTIKHIRGDRVARWVLFNDTRVVSTGFNFSIGKTLLFLIPGFANIEFYGDDTLLFFCKIGV